MTECAISMIYFFRKTTNGASGVGAPLVTWITNGAFMSGAPLVSGQQQDILGSLSYPHSLSPPLHSLHLLLVSGASSLSPHFHHRFIQIKWLNYLVLIGK